MNVTSLRILSVLVILLSGAGCSQSSSSSDAEELNNVNELEELSKIDFSKECVRSTENIFDNPKYLNVGNRKIAYYESEGKGPDVLLVHGNSCSAEAFKFQMNGLLGKVFHLVAIDLPGCGKSDNASDPAEYSPLNYPDLLADIADQLKLENAVYAGWSFGGHILLESSDVLPNPAGILIFGTPPMGKPFSNDAFLPNPAMNYSFMPVLTDTQINEYVASFFKPDAENIPQLFYDDLRRTDGLLRQYLGASLMAGEYKNEVEIIKTFQIPLAIIHGRDDQLVNINYIKALTIPTLWKDSVHIIADAGHAVQIEHPREFNMILAAFVIDCNIRCRRIKAKR